MRHPIAGLSGCALWLKVTHNVPRDAVIAEMGEVQQGEGGASLSFKWEQRIKKYVLGKREDSFLAQRWSSTPLPGLWDRYEAMSALEAQLFRVTKGEWPVATVR